MTAFSQALDRIDVLILSGPSQTKILEDASEAGVGICVDVSVFFFETALCSPAEEPRHHYAIAKLHGCRGQDCLDRINERGGEVVAWLLKRG